MASKALMSYGVAAVFPPFLSSGTGKYSKFGGGMRPMRPNAGRITMMAANWMPGQPRPPYLDGSAPG